jgi:DNA-binding SARP family transcriptional activator
MAEVLWGDRELSSARELNGARGGAAIRLPRQRRAPVFEPRSEAVHLSEPRSEAVHLSEPRPEAVHLSLLGGFSLRVGATQLPITAGLQRPLALLALHHIPLRRDYVAGMLWAETTEERAHGSLRSMLWKLRFCGVPLVETRGDCLQLAPNVEVDLAEVTRLSRDLVAGGFAEESVQLLEPKCTRELLPGWYEDWVLVERERHRQLSLHALELLCEHLTQARRYGAAILAGLAAIDREPLRESAYRALIRTHLAESNAGEAIRQYRRYVELADRELGVAPSPTMRELIGPLVAA